MSLAIAKKAKETSSVMATTSTEKKNHALRTMARLLDQRRQDILQANQEDLQRAQEKGLSTNMIDRLRFGDSKIQSRIQSLEMIADLPDPIGQPIHSQRRPNGLFMSRVRVPLGVIMMVYEARPHVTINAGAFCLKSGNSAILRGGSEAKRCNELLGKLWQEALLESGLPGEAVQVITGSHEEIHELLQLNDYINLVIPRGGKKLIQTVNENSKIPVIKHFEGVCHVYLDEGCDWQSGMNIALDSKCLMPEVCNAMETTLLHSSLETYLPVIVKAFQEQGVTVRGCERTQKAGENIEAATEEDWRTEYLDRIVSIRMVDSLDEAIDHINTYGSHHTDSIITDSHTRANRFLKAVDSGVVLLNASTMYCDGASLGMGAEIGISTDKIHARGPMGLEDLTSYKFVIHGEGHIMGETRFRPHPTNEE